MDRSIGDSINRIDRGSIKLRNSEGDTTLTLEDVTVQNVSKAMQQLLKQNRDGAKFERNNPETLGKKQ